MDDRELTKLAREVSSFLNKLRRKTAQVIDAPPATVIMAPMPEEDAVFEVSGPASRDQSSSTSISQGGEEAERNLKVVEEAAEALQAAIVAADRSISQVRDPAKSKELRDGLMSMLVQFSQPPTLPSFEGKDFNPYGFDPYGKQEVPFSFSKYTNASKIKSIINLLLKKGMLKEAAELSTIFKRRG